MSKRVNDYGITVYGGDFGERSENDPPAVNVKCYMFGRDAPEGCVTDQLRADHPELTEADADRIGEMAWETTVDDFWNIAAPAMAEEYLIPAFGPLNGDPEATGRMGGWLIMTGLPPVPDWSVNQRVAWSHFEDAIHAYIRKAKSWTAISELIADNGWVESKIEDAKAITVTLSPTELDTIIAALRSISAPYTEAELEAIASEHGPPLDAEAIGDLCERLNNGGN